jgi:hypothetical protein
VHLNRTFSVPTRSRLNGGAPIEQSNGLVAQIPKVPKDRFDAVLRSLLSAAPMPMADIPHKRDPKTLVKHGAKKRR